MAIFEHTIRTADADLRVSESSGPGLPVLMIHGSGGSRHVFDRQLSSPLGAKYRLIAFDLPGHGDSSDAGNPSSTYTLTGLAACAATVLDRLDVSGAAVLGWSLGGHVAIELMSFHAAVAGVMLCGAPPVSRGVLGMLRGFHANWDILLASKKSFSRRDAERFDRLCFGEAPDPRFLDGILRADGRLRSTFTRSLMLGSGADQRRVVEEAEVPVAIVNGENDPFVRLGYFESISYRSLWERCHVISGVGHAPFWEAADPFNQILGRFVDFVAAEEILARPVRYARAAG
jgi:pimeloyl-ACP methyl ester carboxylesterase